MAQQKLNLLHFSSGGVAQAGTRPPQIVGSDSREAELGRVLLDNMPNDSLGHALTPGLSGSTNAPKHPTGGDSRRRQPVVNGLLHPLGNRNGPDVSTLSNQIHDGPVVFASLEQVDSQFGEFTTPEGAAQQDGQEGSIALAFQGVGFRSLPETASFLRRQPIPKPDAQFLGPFDTTYARSKLRAQQPGVGRLLSEPTDCSQSHVDGPRR